MKGFITRGKLAFCLGAGISILAGCNCYRDLVDPCWPERYASEARHSIRDLSNAQADKGHMLDQTVWNWMFETDAKGNATANLNAAGIEQLKLISRRMPVPDTQVFLQTAQDVPYKDAVTPERLISQRGDLNNRRIQSIQRFLATQTIAATAIYHVAIHDVAPPGIIGNPIVGTRVPAPPIQGAYEKYEDNFHAKLPNITGFGGVQTGQ